MEPVDGDVPASEPLAAQPEPGESPEGVTREMTHALARARVGVLLVAFPFIFMGLFGLVWLVIIWVSFAEEGRYGTVPMLASGALSVLPAALAYCAWKLVGYARSLEYVNEYRDLVSAEDAIIRQRKFWRSFGMVHVLLATPVALSVVIVALVSSGTFEEGIKLQRWSRQERGVREYDIKLETTQGRVLSVECYHKANYCVCLDDGEQVNDIDHFGKIPSHTVDAVGIGRACGWNIDCPQGAACFAAGR